MRVPLPEQRRARVEMLPLIDIIFLLLVFFIYAMMSMALHRGLPVELPESAAAQKERENATIAVTLRKDGSVFIDGVKTGLDGLRSALRARTAGNRNPAVLLFADREVSYQRVFAVLDRINQAGISRVSMQADAGGP